MGTKLIKAASSGGGGGISWDGSTANGVATFNNSDEATAEANLTFNGSLLTVTGDILATDTIYFGAETATTIGDGATGVIDWNNNQKQKVTITGTGITCNFTDPGGPCNLLLKVVQGDGSDVIGTWDGDIKWPGGSAPTLSTGNGDIDIITFYWDGTNYFGSAALDFS